MFKDWLFAPQTRAIIAEQEYAYGAVPGSPTPNGFPPIERFTQKSIPFEQMNAYFDLYREKIRDIWR